MTLVLVVDDVPPLAEQYAYDLKRMGGYEVADRAGRRSKALEVLASAPGGLRAARPRDAGDGRIRGASRRWSGRASQVPVIVYTGTGNYDRCVQAIRLGAYGFIDKAEPMERVVHEIESALERRRLRAESPHAPPPAGPGDLAGRRAAPPWRSSGRRSPGSRRCRARC